MPPWRICADVIDAVKPTRTKFTIEMMPFVSPLDRMIT